MSDPVQDFDTGLWLCDDQWLSFWHPEMDYDEWEKARAEARDIIIKASRETKRALARKLTLRAKTNK